MIFTKSSVLLALARSDIFQVQTLALPTGSDILVEVGPSDNQSTEITVDNLTNYECPPTVNKDNWDTGTCSPHCDADDAFDVSVSGTKVTVQKPNANGWGINLAFTCSFIGTTSPSGSPTDDPTPSPTLNPSASPSGSPSLKPTADPTADPTTSPTDTLTSKPSGTPTLIPSASPTESPTESPTDSPTESPTKAPKLVVCGKGTGCREGNVQPATESEVHPVRCCANTRLGGGWVKQDHCNVWASSLTPHCHEASFAKAWQLCNDAGARLCTKTELADSCTIKSGCRFDGHLVWSSSPEVDLEKELQELRDELAQCRGDVQ